MLTTELERKEQPRLKIFSRFVHFYHILEADKAGLCCCFYCAYVQKIYSRFIYSETRDETQAVLVTLSPPVFTDSSLTQQTASYSHYSMLGIPCTASIGAPGRSAISCNI